MGYIGPSPNPGQNREVDDISSSFNGGTASFTLQVNGQNVSPGSANAIIVSLGGVVQNPGTDYTVAASTITFTTNPASGLSFFGLVLGQGIDSQTIADGQSPTMAAPSITGDLSIADKIVHTGDTNTAIRFPAADTITAETGGSERVRVDSSGNVGIGTTSPAQIFHVKNSGTHTTWRIENDNADFLIQAGDAGADGLHFYDFDNSAYRMTIANSGKVGIGTTSPSQKLQVTSGNILLDGTDQFIYLSSDADQWLSANAASNYLRFGTGNAERMRLRATTGGLMINDDGSTRIGEPKLHVLNGGAGNNVASFFFNTTDDRDAILIRHNGATTGTGRKLINFLSDQGNSAGFIICDRTSTTYNTGSDYRLKENEVLISDGITRLKTLKPYRFNFKDNPSKIVDGFFAHEVTAVPEAIAGIKDETEDILYTEEDTIPSGKNIGDIKETIPKYQGIDQSRLVPLLTAALQEAIAKIEVLETKVAALEAA